MQTNKIKAAEELKIFVFKHAKLKGDITRKDSSIIDLN